MTDVAVDTEPNQIVPANVGVIHPVVASVVSNVYNDPTVAPENAATVAAGILNGIAQYAPEVLSLTRSSPSTRAWSAVGIGVLASILRVFFPHPGLTRE